MKQLPPALKIGQRAATPVYDNISNLAALKAQAEMDIKAKKQAAINAMRYKQGQIKSLPKETLWSNVLDGASKAVAIAAHPVTAASYTVKGQRIPDNFQRANVNNYDLGLSILNPGSVAYSASEIPGNIADGDYTSAAFNTMGTLPALGLAPALLKKTNPLLYNVSKQLAKEGNYGKMAAIHALSAVDGAGPMIMKTPGLKQLYKKAAYNVASKSGGDQSIEPTKVFKKVFFPKSQSSYANYAGSTSREAAERDLVRQYIYGDSPGFEQIDIKPYGLEKYVDRYGDMNVYKMRSKVPHGEALELDKNSSFADAFQDALKKSGGNDAAKQRGYVTMALNQFANPVSPIDDVAGHTARLSKTLPDGYKLTSQDIWKFHPDDYLQKWGTGVDRASQSMRPSDYVTYLQAKLLERAGKPFVLMQENPLKWIDNAPVENVRKIDLPKDVFKSYSADDLINNPNLDENALLDNLNSIELFDAVKDNSNGILKRKIKKQGGPIVDPRGQWAHPGQRTMVPTPTGQITMKGVPYPVYGQDETGYGQMMMPGGEYRFPGQMVDEIPMMRGGGEEDNEEPTLMRNRRVGTIRKPIAKVNLRPVYDMKAPVWEDWYVKNCPDGVGCSKQATISAQKITGLPYSSYAPADAGYRDAVAERYGLTNVFDQEGDQKRNANSRGKGWKYPSSQDFKNWKAGDIVTLDKGDDLYFPYSAPGGFSEKDNSNLTHNGMVYGFDKSGRPIIKHGYQTGKNRGRGITEVLGDDGRVSSFGHGKYAIKSVWRPKEVNDDNTINTVVDVVDDGQARATRKKNTTSNQSFYVKDDFTDTNSPADYFSGAVNRSETKQRLVDMFNNEKLDKELQYKLGMTADEVDNIKPVIYGVFGQETNFNDVNNMGAAPKEILGSILGVGSRGPAQIKLDSLSKDERKILGIKRASDLEKDDVSYKAAMLLLNNARKRMNMEVEQGTHPELQNADEYFRAGYYYNSPARSISSAKEWGKKSKPVTLNPLTWFNKLSTRERPGVFAGVNPNYAEQEELRMDKGSYPYKLMEKARDLGVDVDFDNASDLEEIVIRGAKKGTNYKKMANGGLLSRSVSCSNCGHSWQAIDGGLDPLSCHKCGGMVKMQVGGQRAPIYTNNPNDPRLRAYQDSLSLSSRPRRNPNPMISVSNFDKLHYAGASKAYAEKNIMPVGFRDFSTEPYRASEPVFAKPKQRVEYRKPQPAVAQQQPQILPAQQPTTPAYRMQGSTPVYGPSNSLIGMMNQQSGEFYPDYMNTAGRARVNQADADMIGNQQKILEYLRMKGVNNAQVIPQKKNGGQPGIPLAQDGWVQRAANANLNFWEKCGLASDANNGGGGGGPWSGGGYKSAKYKNPYEELSDIDAYDKDERKSFKSTLPQGVDIKDWVAFNRDASRMNSLLSNPDYDKYVDSTGTLKPEYQTSATQFDPYFLYYKPAFMGKKSVTANDIMNYHMNQPHGISGFKELANRRYMPQKHYGGNLYKSGGQHGGLDRWFAEKWVDVKTGKDCGRQDGESRAGYPACRPSRRVSSQTPKTSSEMSAAEKAKFKRSKTSSERINYNHKRN